jgi:phosphopantothenoylcysteine decarboxylase/phosphopantothenate--cysteine ligase
VSGNHDPATPTDVAPDRAPIAPIRRIVLGIAGSIGALDVPQSILWLRHARGIEVRAIMTRQAITMVTARAIAVTSGQPVALDDEGPSGDPVIPHIELTRWADLLLVLPATANIFGKAAQGIADDLLSTCVLAAACPVVFVPSMNEQMWRKPAVQRNVATLQADGYGVVAPINGRAVVDGQSTGCIVPEIDDVLDWAERFIQRSATTSRVNGSDHAASNGIVQEVRAG